MSATHPGHSISNDSYSLEQVVISFQQAVIDRIQLVADGHLCNYSEYLGKPEYLRSGDEANAVDQQFTRYTLEWLGFDSANWTYNQPLSGKKANRPDYIVRGSIGTAFIWEDKNSTVDLNEEQIAQMRRYSVGTAGYAVWCNMRRILGIRFLPSDTLKYETLVDVAIEELFAKQAHGETSLETQASNLALFQVLFRKERFSQFTKLIEKICIDEVMFEQQAIALDQPQTMKNFITGSRQSLDHLRLAALLQVREALAGRHKIFNEEASLRQEWEAARDELLEGVS